MIFNKKYLFSNGKLMTLNEIYLSGRSVILHHLSRAFYMFKRIEQMKHVVSMKWVYPGMPKRGPGDPGERAWKKCVFVYFACF